MFDYHFIEVLDAIVVQGSFQGAARVLHLTQSAVSQRLRSLEEQVGARLIIRSQPPRPTSLGKILLDHVRQVKRLEQEVKLAMKAAPGSTFSSITLGINSDSLATWFFDAITPVVKKGGFLLDLVIENEDVTFARLQRGEVLGCISSRSRRLAGCEVERLGTMKYRCASTPEFSDRFFKKGLTEETLLSAPAVIFDDFDDMHKKFFEKKFGLKGFDFPHHRIAGSNAFLDAIRFGIAYGMAPELQASGDYQSGYLVDLAPRKVWTQELFWHCQRRGDEKVEQLSKQIVVRARKVLR